MSVLQVDIRSLAKLARLEVSDAEVAKLEREIPGILSLVETVQKVATDVPAHQPALRNVMRDDASPHASGAYTETLLAAVPGREGDKIAVKQVISRK
ncbi:aspartyl/glutamyl-tRNA amidotransferase subunit C [Candidatus Kaiserbacteria bacterium]|nr:aspartyl/glutamyl-tRNA amidotransferase subunit C [Candidatus Kaiserbacteria bacterium]